MDDFKGDKGFKGSKDSKGSGKSGGKRGGKRSKGVTRTKASAPFSLANYSFLGLLDIATTL